MGCEGAARWRHVSGNMDPYKEKEYNLTEVTETWLVRKSAASTVNGKEKQ